MDKFIIIIIILVYFFFFIHGYHQHQVNVLIAKFVPVKYLYNSNITFFPTNILTNIEYCHKYFSKILNFDTTVIFIYWIVKGVFNSTRHI